MEGERIGVVEEYVREMGGWGRGMVSSGRG